MAAFTNIFALLRLLPDYAAFCYEPRQSTCGHGHTVSLADASEPAQTATCLAMLTPRNRFPQPKRHMPRGTALAWSPRSVIYTAMAFTPQIRRRVHATALVVSLALLSASLPGCIVSTHPCPETGWNATLTLHATGEPFPSHILGYLTESVGGCGGDPRELSFECTCLYSPCQTIILPADRRSPSCTSTGVKGWLHDEIPDGFLSVLSLEHGQRQPFLTDQILQLSYSDGDSVCGWDPSGSADVPTP